eukprot:CAMPEP_0197036514 /NCGR_PEP_ID=MMETSP1384-20130603/13999_1 /TAXON_ID=29189 /ORGANISM="Ammonia sp." /LENGTH=85 /DNA_ID=CAMNT_0042466701 /DNA_START=29 /DNA_END=282 /DNA_ORIENTATION=+
MGNVAGAALTLGASVLQEHIGGNNRAKLKAQEEQTKRHNASLLHQQRMAELRATAESQKRADEAKRARNEQIYKKEMERIRNENA